MEKNYRKLKLNKAFLILTFILLGISIGLVIDNYLEEYNYILPAIDTYFFCSQTNNIVEKGFFLKYSPDYVDQENIYAPGFSLFLSIVSIIINLNTRILIYFLPFLSIPLTFLSLFMFIKSFKIKKRILMPVYFISILTIFSSILAFRDLIIGIPQTFYLSIIFLSLAITNKLKDSQKYMPPLIIILAGLFLAHYVSFILVILYIALYFILNYKTLKNKKFFFWIFLLILLIIIPLIKSGIVGLFNINYAAEFNLNPFEFSQENVNKFIGFPIIIVGFILTTMGLFNKRHIVLNIFLIALLSTLFLYKMPLIHIFSPYVKRAMIFIILFISISIPINLLENFNKFNKYTRIILILIIISLIFFNIYSYRDKIWVKYFESDDVASIKNLMTENKIVAFFPYNLLIQCYLDSPTKNIIRLNPVDINKSNILNYYSTGFNQGTFFYYNKNSLNILKKSGLKVDDKIINKLVDSWEEVYYSRGNVTIYRKK